jgi:enoyl-CoA hydratase
MHYKCFDLSIEDGIAHIRFSRPGEYNSMIREFWTELPEAIDDISDNARARVIVISSTGKHFCSGMDLAVFSGDDGLGGPQNPDPRTTEQRNEAMRITVRSLQHTISCLDDARMPVLMAIQGGCIGGAVNLSSAADCRYITQDGFFCIQEINIGMTADVGTFPRLCHLLPQGMLREIASKSPLAITGAKVMMNYARDHTIADSLDYIALWQSGMFQPAEMGEAFAAKTEKRASEFPDLVPIKKGL